MHSAVYQVSWSQESTDASQQNEELKTRMVMKNDDLCMDQPAHHWSKCILCFSSLRIEMTNYPAS